MMSCMSHDVSPESEILVLREMIRLAERRRDEEIAHIERVNRYNLALIAFAGSFLSLLISTDVPLFTFRIVGGVLILSLLLSLVALLPRTVEGGALLIDEDVLAIRKRNVPALSAYLLETANLTEQAASRLATLSISKKKWTICSAIVLVIAIATMYVLSAYA